MRHITKRTKIAKRGMRVYLTWIVSGVFIVATVFLTLTTATSGAEIAKLEDEEANLVSLNRELSDQIVMASSLSATSEKAESLGFAKPEKVLYISSQSTVAAK